SYSHGSSYDLLLLSFPTRRSSDLLYVDVIESSHEFRLASRVGTRRPVHATSLGKAICAFLPEELLKRTLEGLVLPSLTPNTVIRSEEHTSELQSHLNLVCRLLLEK